MTEINFGTGRAHMNWMNQTFDDFNLTITLTFKCNLRCRYCYVNPSSSFTIEKKDIESAINMAIAKINTGGTLHLGFFGGEPLLESNLLWWSVEKALELASPFSIKVKTLLTTNGTLINDEFLEKASQNSTKLTISVDGTQKSHNLNRIFNDGKGSYQQAMNGLKMSLKVIPETSVNMVVNPQNVNELAKGLTELFDLGVMEIDVSIDYSAPWTPLHLEMLEREYRKIEVFYSRLKKENENRVISLIDNKIAAITNGGIPEKCRCSLGTNEITVMPDGNLVACERLVTDIQSGRENPYVVGKSDKGIHGPAMKRLTEKIQAESPNCIDCEMSPYCINDCFCTNVCRTGEAAQPDGLICITEQLAVELAGSVISRLASRKENLSNKQP